MPFRNASLQLKGGLADLRGCWEHAGAIVSLVYQVTRKLLSVPAVLLRRQAAKETELLLLRHENAARRLLASPGVEPGGSQDTADGGCADRVAESV